ncbi:uncharacterized protein LOC126856140 isoform X2 [Cataglyphis hispanica]|uniref:uncharacterized protein LOC126856140 isoform X2 n=1 Tax=Cataglyphis hispanica TaxID=1086592 RepID=UPI00217FD259|nr:uncharacterized protein LOC126856140 isoform X2 [Cataglyphis hispanica]
MTKCIKKEVNLKSSTYNQKGERYYNQIIAYNSMSKHLRRVLSAKSVINSRNKNYLLKKQRYKDILRISLKYENGCNCNSDYQQSKVFRGRTCCEQMSHRSTSKSYRTVSPATICSPRYKRVKMSSASGKKSKCMREISRIIDPSTYYSQQRKCRYEEESFYPCTTAALDSSAFKSESQSLIQEIIDRRSISSNASQCNDYDYDDQSVELKHVSKQLLSPKKEEKEYVKFIYNITKEIIEKGFYTDKELRNVFKKHIDLYKGILNMNKMLQEIYQLKISLNMTDDSDTDDELEELINAQKLLSISEIRPPTPPKILDDNKVMEKLESYQKMSQGSQEYCKQYCTKSVTLVDANPDLFVTERDVLTSLVEVGIDPKQVQHICKNLRCKSRDNNMMQTTKEVSYPLNLEVNDLEKLQNNNRQISPEIKIVKSAHDSVADNSPRSLEEQDIHFKLNLVFTQQETEVETQKEIKSETKLENDKVDS